MKKAGTILENHELCYSCFGRLFGKLGHGLTNRERGKALINTLVIIGGARLEDINEKEENCEICGGLFDSLDEFAEKGKRKLAGYDYDSFLVGNKMVESILKSQKSLENHYELDNSEEPGKEFNREVGKKTFRLLSADGKSVSVDLEDPHIQVIFDLSKDTINLQIKPVYIYGRYKKYSRSLPQTPWHCNSCNGKGCEDCDYTGRLYRDSLAELIGEPILNIAKGDSFLFHGAGREDVDAKMLGYGRPFVVEISRPTLRDFSLKKVYDSIKDRADNRIEVLNLRKVSKEIIRGIKETRTDKEYRVLAEMNNSIKENALREALYNLVGEIRQRTPKRVDHRRADKYRMREVKKAEGDIVEKRKVLLNIRCSGGLYVKELISSDEGRTKPSLSGLLNTEMIVKELDVTQVFGKLVERENGYKYVRGKPNHQENYDYID